MTLSTTLKKPSHIIIQELMAERIRFLEDELYNRAYIVFIKLYLYLLIS